MANATFRAHLDTACTVAFVTWTEPATGESEKTPAKTTRSVSMRIQPVDGEYQQFAAGKRAEATHLAFADSDADLLEGEFVGTDTGPYAGMRWEVVFVNPVHGHHYEVEMKRRYDLRTGEDPLA
jgi:hypothetical protein